MRKIITFKGIFLFFLLAFYLAIIPSYAQQSQEPTISIDSTLVSVPVIVSDRQGRYISGLKQQDFTLYDNQVKQPIAFFDAAQEPLNVALLLDTSKSTQFVLEDIKSAASTFLTQLRAKDKAMVVTFDSRVRFLTPLTNSQSQLERAIEQAYIGERVGTKLNDAVDEAVKELKQVSGRKAIVLLTDGKDHGSSLEAEELIDQVVESNTLIYTVFFETGNFRVGDNPRWDQPEPRRNRRDDPFPRFPHFPRFPRFQNNFQNNYQGGYQGGYQSGRRAERRAERVERKNTEAMDFLTELAEVTAGRMYNSQVTDLKKTFSLIAEELRNQYTLGFYPDNSDFTDEPHIIKVQVAGKDIVVRARRNYRLLAINKTK